MAQTGMEIATKNQNKLPDSYSRCRLQCFASCDTKSR